MADISKIKLPDGITYNIVPEKVLIDWWSSVSQDGLPLLFTDRKLGEEYTGHVGFIHSGPYIDQNRKIHDFDMYVEDISDKYTPSKTSGNWSIGSDDNVYRIKAYRTGSLIQIAIAFHGNGSAVSAGSNGFVGDISDGPLPVQQVTLTGFYAGSILAATLLEDGSITARPFGASCTLSSASRAYLTGTFITNT